MKSGSRSTLLVPLRVSAANDHKSPAKLGIEGAWRIRTAVPAPSDSYKYALLNAGRTSAEALSPTGR